MILIPLCTGSPNDLLPSLEELDYKSCKSGLQVHKMYDKTGSIYKYTRCMTRQLA